MSALMSVKRKTAMEGCDAVVRVERLPPPLTGGDRDGGGGERRRSSPTDYGSQSGLAMMPRTPAEGAAAASAEEAATTITTATTKATSMIAGCPVACRRNVSSRDAVTRTESTSTTTTSRRAGWLKGFAK